MKYKRTILFVLAVFILSLILAACQPGETGDGAGADGPKEVVRLADTQFQTIWINNAIAGYIIEHGYGYPVEYPQVTTPGAQASLESGEIDVWMELWRFNLIDWYDRVIEEEAIIDLGNTYENSSQGWYVPRYVIEGDEERGIEPMAPDLVSVLDLPDYKDLFPDPENPDKGLIVNCITGWQCAAINEVKLYAYELDDDYNLLTPGAAAALDAAIAGANEKGEPILAYYWEPTWLMGVYDMVQLEEPEYTEECNANIDRAKGDNPEVPLEEVDETFGCAYRSFGIHKGVHPSLQERAPELVEFLDKMEVGNDPLSQTSAFMTLNEVEADDAAVWFFRNFEDRWRSWVPEDVAQNVADALADEEIIGEDIDEVLE